MPPPQSDDHPQTLPPPEQDAGKSSPGAMDNGYYRLLVETVRDYAIFVLAATGHLLRWNSGAERLRGYAPADIMGRHFAVLYPPEDMAAGKPPWELETA